MSNRPDCRRVRSDGVSLEVREHSPWRPGAQSLVLVHGYPDQQDVWDPVIANLDLDAFHVVTYDVRGAGGSDVPATRAGYRTERLVEDLACVLEATVPDGGRAHLVGHDWGSVQLWDAVNAERGHPRLQDRIASFTSLSGPSLDHAGLLARRPSSRRQVLRQTAHSWYVYAFHLPLLPDLAWRRGHRVMARLMTRMEGLAAGHWGPELGPNAANGLNLYRANVLRRLRRPRALRTPVPVLVVHPQRDRYLTDVMLTGLEECCSDLTVRYVDAGHWVLRSHPALVSDLVSDHVRAHPG
jgi:pimeloyl-ACP methyl ester carboxylesterase